MGSAVSALQISGWGMAVPDQVVTSKEIGERFGVDEDWVVSRCGIKERRQVEVKDMPDGTRVSAESTASLSIDAGRRALEKAGLTGADIAHLILATATPEQLAPATSAIVHGALGIGGSAMDVNAECTGWLSGLVLATGLMAMDPRPILLIGVAVNSLIAHPEDPNLSILAGDGAGAVVLTPGPKKWVLAWDLEANGKLADALKIVAGGSRMPATVETARQGLHYVQFNGTEIYLNAVRYSVRTVRKTLTAAGVGPDDVDHIIPHQANIRIIDSMLNHAKLRQDRVITNLDRYGNTASASIPMALTEAMEEGRIKDGDLVLLAAFGGGMTWGSLLLRWGGEDT